MQGVECVPALKALSDETRLRILRALAEGPLDVTELSERLGVSSYNASKHLRVLREARLLQVERDGRRRLYSVPKRGDQLKVVGDVLDLGCCTFRFKQL